ncbi:unnamed protein product [Clavelina lepadiformis]|uniref:PDZ domain-containing protein n=1 Tax=Clavelina lepadiformis TaxID=159417 RepID=A0ABP0GVI5_CLALP
MTMPAHKARLCNVVRGANGYGFHLHGEKGKAGQSIQKVEPDSPAVEAGLKAGDRIIEVNGHNVEEENHQQVVARIKERSGETDLLVVDVEAEKYFKDNNIPITQELTENGTPDAESDSDKTDEEKPEVVAEDNTSSDSRRPRSCNLVRGESGYGFNLHSEKDKKGRFIRSVDPDSPAEAAGLKAGDRVIEVNGTNMEYDKHNELVNAIKQGGDQVDLLVVDELSDLFFQSCKVTPTAEHVSGSLPTPVEEPADTPSAPQASASSPADEPTPKATGNNQQANGFDPFAVDLNVLKEKSRQGKKKAPSSNWNNRQAIFNNL